MLIRDLPQRVWVDDRASALYLHDRFIQADLSVERGRAIDHAVPADHGGFNHFAFLELDNKRYDPVEGKIHALHVFTDVGDNFTEGKRYGFKMRLQGSQD